MHWEKWAIETNDSATRYNDIRRGNDLSCFISNYKIKSRFDFTIEDAIENQRQQLVDLKSKLTLEVYDALEKWAIETNDSATYPYDIRRGVYFDNFISKYKKKK